MALATTSRYAQVQLVCEFLLVGLAWYLLVGYLWQDGTIPAGVEFPRNMHSLYVWEFVQQCGSCAWWAPVGGGYPVFADVFGSFLHPIAVLSTWWQGAVTASATTVSLSFLMIGLAAWWFGVHFGIHGIVRVWLAVAAMYGGHMTARLELGTVGLPLSLAAAWLCVVAMLTYLHQPSQRRSVIVGVCLGGFIISGQGYLQLAMVLSLPLWAGLWWYWVRPTSDLRQQYGHLILAGVIALLMAAPLAIGVLVYGHFFAKYTDGMLSMAQPASHIVVNWLVDDFEFAKSDIFNPFPYPWAYSVFIGWVPVVAALTLWHLIRDARHRILAVFLAVWGMYLLVWASMWPIQQLFSLEIAPLQEPLSSLRFMIVVNGLATMTVLSLAALGLHGLIQHPFWQRFRIDISFNQRQVHIGVGVLLAVLLFANITQQYRFGTIWITQVTPTDADQQRIMRDLADLPPGYVELEADWLLVTMLEARYKINNMHMSWWIDGREPPPAQYMVTTENREGFTVVREYWEGWKLMANTDTNATYATFYGADGIPQACDFQSRAGFVDVQCDVPSDGIIRVYEYALPGWTATVNGQSAVVADRDGWVSVPVSIGTVDMQLRFAAWHATFGMMLHVLGYVLAGVLWWYRPPWLQEPADAVAVDTPPTVAVTGEA